MSHIAIAAALALEDVSRGDDDLGLVSPAAAITTSGPPTMTLPMGPSPMIRFHNSWRTGRAAHITAHPTESPEAANRDGGEAGRRISERVTAQPDVRGAARGVPEFFFDVCASFAARYDSWFIDSEAKAIDVPAQDVEAVNQLANTSALLAAVGVSNGRLGPRQWRKRVDQHAFRDLEYARDAEALASGRSPHTVPTERQRRIHTDEALNHSTLDWRPLMTLKQTVPALVIGSGALALALGGPVLAASPHQHHHAGAAPLGAKFVSLAKDSPSNTSPSKQVTVKCPKGHFAVGGGAHLHFPGEPGGVVPLAITQSRPNPDSSAHPTGWVAAGNATGPYSSSWSVEVHVICSH